MEDLKTLLEKIKEKDENALSKYEIDSKKELDELGRFLNGEISLSQANYSVLLNFSFKLSYICFKTFLSFSSSLLTE